MRFFSIASFCLGAGLASVACSGANTGDSSANDDTSESTSQPTHASDAGALDPDAQVDRLHRTTSSASSSAGSRTAASSSSSRSSAASSTGSVASSSGSVASSTGSVASSPSTGTTGSSSSAAAAAGGTTSVTSAKGGPTIGGCSVFPANNPWNTRVDDATAYPVHSNSSTYIANMSPTTHLHADWGDWSSDHYGIPWQTVSGSQALVPMTFDTANESDPGPYPFPSSAMVEGGSGSGGDMHVIVLDTATCMLFETWSSTYVGPGWSCGSGAKFDLSSNALRPAGWTSADAAGLPILPGLVRLAEVQAGSIQHALRFTVSKSQQAYIAPATHAAGQNNASLPPMGLRVRLKASVDLSGFSGPALVILTAMKQYGLILADNGSNWYVSGDSNDGWSSIMDGISSAFTKVTGSDFEAVYTGPLTTAGL